MMEEDNHHDENEAARISDALQEAAETYVTQASPIKTESPLPAKSSVSGTSGGIQPPAPLPSQALGTPAALPPQISGVPGTVSSPLPLQPTISGPPPPPTSGFVPSHGVVSAAPPTKFHNPVSTTDLPQTPATGATASLPGVRVGQLPASGISNVLVPDTSGQSNTTSVQLPTFELPVGVSMDRSPASVLVERSHAESDQPSTPTSAKLSTGGGGLFGWLGGGGIMNKVIEKTKSSVESVITTLDPGMKEVILSGGDVDILVTSTKDSKVGAVRQAFQEVFGRATVTGVESQPSIAPQPVGYTAGLKGAEERIENIRRSGTVDERQPIVSVESFIAELLPDRWYDIGCVLLRDRSRDIELQYFTQATPVPLEYIQAAQERTPSDYDLRWSGLSVTIGQVIKEHLATSGENIDSSDWHRRLNSSVSRRDMIYMTAKTLAGAYRLRIQATAATAAVNM